MCRALLVSLLILIPCSLRAQDKKADWKALYGLRSGEKIVIVYRVENRENMSSNDLPV